MLHPRGVACKFRFSFSLSVTFVFLTTGDCSCTETRRYQNWIMARHLKLLVQRWSSRVFSVEVDGAPRYFGIREQLRGEPVPPDVFSEVQKQDRCYSLLVCSGDRVTGDRFHWELRDRLQRQLPPGSGVRSMSSFIPDQKGSLLKGYFLQSRAGNSSLIEDILTDLEQRNPVLVCSYSQSEDGQQWTQRLWYQSEDNPVRFCVVPSETPKHHPSVLNMINSDVFYSLEEACDVLKQVQLKNIKFSCNILHTGALMWRIMVLQGLQILKI